MLTIISSVFIGTMVYAITKFLLDNVLEQRAIVGDIAFHLHNLSNKFLASALKKERQETISPLVRELSSKLVMNKNKIPFYKYLSILKIVKDTERIDEASKLLVGLSNTIVPEFDEKEIYREKIKEVRENINKICNLLNIKI